MIFGFHNHKKLDYEFCEYENLIYSDFYIYYIKSLRF